MQDSHPTQACELTARAITMVHRLADALSKLSLLGGLLNADRGRTRGRKAVTLFLFIKFQVFLHRVVSEIMSLVLERL